jgi:hypothetical protein
MRGKAQAKVEFGVKIHISVIDGITFLDELSWDAFNEGSHLMDYVEKYRSGFGCYPRELLADQNLISGILFNENVVYFSINIYIQGKQGNHPVVRFAVVLVLHSPRSCSQGSPFAALTFSGFFVR